MNEHILKSVLEQKYAEEFDRLNESKLINQSELLCVFYNKLCASEIYIQNGYLSYDAEINKEVGVIFSGGVDSSYLALLLKEISVNVPLKIKLS